MTNVSWSDESISFDVDQVGVPVLVRVSYFPNWKATGADGPYRVAPNFMVVVPDQHPRPTGLRGVDSSTMGAVRGHRCSACSG